MRTRNVAYITKDSTREEIYAAYEKATKNLKDIRCRLKTNQDKVKEVRIEKNKKYNQLKYQLLKKEQKIYGMQKHIFNLQRFAVSERAKAKKKGIEIGRSRLRTNDASIVKMYEFLMQIDHVIEILGMKLSYCSFLLWAGRYEFFNFKDFQRDMPNARQNFHYYLKKFVPSGHIVNISTDNIKKQYALTGSGIDLFNKINNFTKKHFK